MLHSHYPLQALLYSVVLHRYLRWRLPGVRPRAATSAASSTSSSAACAAPRPRWSTATPPGSSRWRPPVALVEAMSDLLDGRGRRWEGAR